MARGLCDPVDVDSLRDSLHEGASKVFGDYDRRMFSGTAGDHTASIACLFGTLVQQGLLPPDKEAAVFINGGTYQMMVYRFPTGLDDDYVINVDVVLKTDKIHVNPEGLSFEDGTQINFAMRYHSTYDKKFCIKLDSPEDKDKSLGQVAEEVIKCLRL